MKPRTVYEKAVQDLTEAAKQLARLDQNLWQVSFEPTSGCRALCGALACGSSLLTLIPASPLHSRLRTQRRVYAVA
jgi:hypothetical protein